MTRNKETAYRTPLYKSRLVRCPDWVLMSVRSTAGYMVGGEMKVSTVRHAGAMLRPSVPILLLFRFFIRINLFYKTFLKCQYIFLGLVRKVKGAVSPHTVWSSTVLHLPVPILKADKGSSGRFSPAGGDSRRPA